MVIDGRGTSAFSDFRVVQTQAATGLERCSKTVYGESSSSTSIGGIVGGVLGAIVLILLGVLYYCMRRRRHIRDNLYKSRPPTPDSMMSNRPDGLARAGTFNLRSVAFTEQSLDHLRASDAPPTYAPGERSPAEHDGARSPAEYDGSEGYLDQDFTGVDRAAEGRVGAGAAEARATRDLAGL